MRGFSYSQAYLFNTGTDIMSYNLLGVHPLEHGSESGFSFSVWAPEAGKVFVVGDFNGWNEAANPLTRMGETGIFYCEIDNAQKWQKYKYYVVAQSGKGIFKSDPYAFWSEMRPDNASVIYPVNDGFEWSDNEYMIERDKEITYENTPVNIYELHLGSWRRKSDGSFLNYRELSREIAEYVSEMGFTHIELMPIMEHPLDDSWGYQVTGFFSPTSRYGTPEALKYFIDYMHKYNIKVILDWVPGHFPKDETGLARFDGSYVYEYADDRIGEHKQWGTLVFNYSRAEVRSFLISNAIYWLEIFHADGIRVDAVSSMLYLNYCREEYIRNSNGGIENLEAISFLRSLNETIRNKYPGVMIIAEESTAWAKVTAPVSEGGLGFTHKWNMGWMHDTLEYFSRDYIYRKWHHSQLSFSLLYAFSENFILPISHDEVVHGKKSALDKMPGDYWRKFASLKTLYGYMMAHPGAKLLFMGSEFGQFVEWKFNQPLEWFLLEYDQHSKLQDFVKILNQIYKNEKSMWENNHNWEGFMWNNADDSDNGVFAFSRISRSNEEILVVLNMTPVPHEIYRIGVNRVDEYQLILDSDLSNFGGSNYIKIQLDKKCKTTDKGCFVGNIRIDCDQIKFLSVNESFGDFPCSLDLIVPPLSVIYLKLN